MANEVLETTRYVLENPQFVKIDGLRVLQLAKEWVEEEFTLPTWDIPVYPEGKTNEVIDYFLLNDSINFAFTDFTTKEKFTAEYEGKPWRGALGMTGCLKKAIDSGVPLLDAGFLQEITRPQMEQIFRGNIEIPMLDERLEIFHEVGKVLEKKYDGHFYNLVEASNNRLFNRGTGMVERLVNDFPSFDDAAQYKGRRIVFNKRAQLASGMIYERFEGDLKIDDIDDITIFLDYVIPKGLRDKGTLVYEESLARRVDNQEIIYPGSMEEVEIRSSAAHVANELIESINLYREPENLPPINALHMDAKLWLNSRSKEGKPHHLTPTIAY